MWDFSDARLGGPGGRCQWLGRDVGLKEDKQGCLGTMAGDRGVLGILGLRWD